MDQELADILLKYSRDGIMLISSDTSYCELNDAMRTLLGGNYLHDKTLKPSIPSIYRRYEFPGIQLKEIREKLKTESTTGVFEALFTNYDNEVIPVEIKVNNLKTNKGGYYLLIFRDISRFKDREKKIQEVLGEVKQAKEKAERSDRLKTTFLSNISHEIRTPMNSILGFSELLDDNSVSGEERSEIIKIIQSNGDKLLRLINNIIDISRLQAGDLVLDLEETDLNKFLKGAYEQWKSKILKDKANLKLKLNIPEVASVFVISDTIRLKNVIDHLMDNAIKFSDKGTIELGYTINRNNKVDVFVKDEGVGIRSDILPGLFEVFNKQNELENDLVAGTGIGLSLVKNLIELMNASVEISSEVNKGTKVSLIFNGTKFIEKKVNDSVFQFETPKYNWPDKKVLIVEDNDFNYEYLFAVLHQRVKEIIWAPTGNDAILACENTKFDIVLLDMQLPDMHGLEVLQHIRSIHEDIPVVAQTAFAIVGDKQKIIDAGCDDYMSKPIKPRILLETMNKFFIKKKVYEK